MHPKDNPDSVGALEGSERELAKRLLVNVTNQREYEGIRMLRATQGHVAFELEIPSTTLNYHGSIHGGFISALYEIGAGMVAHSFGRANVAISSSMNFIHARGLGKVTVTASALHSGQSTAVVRSQIVHESGRMLASSTFTMFYVE